MKRAHLAAVVLAAGRGRRMGRRKVGLAIGGELLIERAARRLGAAGAEVVAVVHNPDPAAGPFDSLRIGLGALGRAKTTFVLPVDVPCCGASSLARLVAAVRAGAAAAVPTFAGRGGHPVLLSAPLARRVARMRSGRLDRVLRALGARVARVPVRDPSVTRNLNAPRDLTSMPPKVSRTPSGGGTEP